MSDAVRQLRLLRLAYRVYYHTRLPHVTREEPFDELRAEEFGMPSIGLIGGTGNEGRGLALRFALAGEDVIIGSRSRERADSTAAAVRGQLTEGGRRIRSGTNAEAAAGSDLTCLCLPVPGVEPTVGELRAALRGRIVLEVLNPVRRTPEGFESLPLPAPSAAEWVAALLPDSAVVSAFKTLSAKHLCEVGEPLRGDAFVCSDDQRAKQIVVDMIGRIADLHAVDCGPLRNARYVEAATVLLLELNRRHRATTSLRILGLD